MQAYLSQTLPTGMDRMEKLLVERGGQFMVGNRLTWADVAIFCLIDPEKKNNTELMVTRPCLDNLLGNRLTWADLAIFCLIDPEKKNNTELMVTRPCLDNLLGRVAEVPNIANWLNSRPETIM